MIFESRARSKERRKPLSVDNILLLKIIVHLDGWNDAHRRGLRVRSYILEHMGRRDSVDVKFGECQRRKRAHIMLDTIFDSWVVILYTPWCN